MTQTESMSISSGTEALSLFWGRSDGRKQVKNGYEANETAGMRNKEIFVTILRHLALLWGFLGYISLIRFHFFKQE